MLSAYLGQDQSALNKEASFTVLCFRYRREREQRWFSPTNHINYPDLQVVVLVPFWIEGVLAGVCGVALTRAVYTDLGKGIWQTCPPAYTAMLRNIVASI